MRSFILAASNAWAGFIALCWLAWLVFGYATDVHEAKGWASFGFIIAVFWMWPSFLGWLFVSLIPKGAAREAIAARVLQ